MRFAIRQYPQGELGQRTKNRSTANHTARFSFAFSCSLLVRECLFELGMAWAWQTLTLITNTVLVVLRLGQEKSPSPAMTR
jgi:hypothetical protein